LNRLQIINQVLRKLREDEVSVVADDTYATMLADFLNDVKREVEDAWDWTQLRQIITVTTAASTSQYSLTGFGKRGRIKQAYNDTDDNFMMQVHQQYINYQNYLSTNNINDSPHNYRIRGVDASGDMQIDVYPTPDAVESLRFDCVVPQADLSDDTTELTVPDYPVMLGLYARAVSERGEDGGIGYNEADMAYKTALSDAIAQDGGRAKEDLMWVVQ